jgi:hypothetical protein
MFAAHHIRKSCNIHPILNYISYRTNPVEQVGLIGPFGWLNNYQRQRGGGAREYQHVEMWRHMFKY